MLDSRKTIENVHHVAPDKNSATRSQESNEEEADLAQETRASVETVLEKPHQPKKPESAANILRDFAKELQNHQKKIILHVAKKTARTQDFGTSELNKTYKKGTNNIQSVLIFLFKKLERLGLKKIQATEPTNHGRKNHYLITKLISDPSEEPKETDKSKIKNGKTQYQKVIKNLDFIPSKLHEILLFLTLSSKYDKWVDYNEIFRETGQNQRKTAAQTQNLQKILPKIGLELLEEKNKKGTKYFHLTTPSKAEAKRREFQKKEREKQEKKQRSNNQAAKARHLPKTRTTSTSNTILQRRPKNPPDELDELYDDDELNCRPRKLWEDASGKGG